MSNVRGKWNCVYNTSDDDCFNCLLHGHLALCSGCDDFSIIHDEKYDENVRNKCTELEEITVKAKHRPATIRRNLQSELRKFFENN